jgi:hypothetical protein
VLQLSKFNEFSSKCVSIFTRVLIPKLIFKYVNLFTICISKGYVYLDYGRNVKNVMNNASKDIVYRIILIIYIYMKLCMNMMVVLYVKLGNLLHIST